MDIVNRPIAELEKVGSLYDLVKKGFMPKYTLEQVKSNVEKLATKGIIVKNTIVDLA